MTTFRLELGKNRNVHLFFCFFVSLPVFLFAQTEIFIDDWNRASIGIYGRLRFDTLNHSLISFVCVFLLLLQFGSSQ